MKDFFVLHKRLLLLAFGVFIVLSPFLFLEPLAVIGNSMAPTIGDGDRIIVEKLSKYFDVPERSEIMVFREPHERKEIFVKRVIGLPGETIKVERDSVTILHHNGTEEIFQGSTLDSENRGRTLESLIGGRDNGEPHTRVLGPEDYFVMGDNRQVSTDSRHWGTVQPPDIIGRPLIVLSAESKGAGSFFSNLVYRALSFIGWEDREASGAYHVTKSLRFNDDDTAYLNRTPAGVGNLKTWTWSGWIKRANLTEGNLFTSATDGTDYTTIYVRANDKLEFSGDNGTFQVITTQVFRDPTAWYHVVVAIDTTQATAANRVRMYVNGTEVTSFSTATYPSQNADTDINATKVHRIGHMNAGGALYWDGYMADIYLIDGQALTPSSFGETDTTTSAWKPKSYTGTYGTNGFKLDFSDCSGVTSSTLGNDGSSNNNDWTPNGFSVTAGFGNDCLTDSPTNYGSGTSGGDVRGNFATFNALWKGNLSAGSASNFTLSEGNLRAEHSATTDNEGVISTMAMASGKWYAEFLIGNSDFVDVASVNVNEVSARPDAKGGTYAGGYAYQSNGQKQNNNSASAYGNSYTNGDIISVAFDADDGKVWFAKNGTWQNSGDPAAGTGEAFTVSAGSYYFGAFIGETGHWNANFGSHAFTYTPPSGFKPLTTQYLADPAIPKPSTYFNAITYSSPILLLHADGTDAATTFTDSSQSGKAITANGNAQIDTAQSVFGGASALFDGSGDYLSAADSADWTLGTNDFTLDFRVRFNSVADTQQGFVRQLAHGGSTGWTLTWNGGDGLAFYEDGATTPVNYSSFSPSVNIWYHIAVTRSGNTWRIFIDGTKVAEATSSASISDDGNLLMIGRGSTHGGIGDWNTISEAYELNGWMDEFRLIKGVALYTTDFTPSTAAYIHGVNTANFQPDLVWLKDRTSVNDHGLFDSVRGVQNWLASNLTGAEVASTTSLTSFDSAGFTLGNSGTLNKSGSSYISWNWKESATSGFDIVTYTGTGVARTIAHSLGAIPKMIITKRRDSAVSWGVGHEGISWNRYLLLNATDASTADSAAWNNATGTASVFSVGDGTIVNTNGGTYVAYLWSEIEGFSKFGSYTGNGSAEGPFLYTGFKPRYVMIKRTDTADNWQMLDTARSSTGNPVDEKIEANSTNAEAANNDNKIDVVANGFKLRGVDAGSNASAGTYVYAAFAEMPFKYASAGFGGATGKPLLFVLPF